jgi:23S rRNA G2445 N2-methylase RlmL
MGEIDKLKKLYHQFAEHLKQNFKGMRLYIFTGNPELRKEIALQTSKRIPFYNGNIECRLLRYELH